MCLIRKLQVGLLAFSIAMEFSEKTHDKGHEIQCNAATLTGNSRIQLT